jgi:acyl-CoA carboxylase epsilon subunit-like protein
VKLETLSGSPTADELAAIVAALDTLFAEQQTAGPAAPRWRSAGRDFETELAAPRGWSASPRF